MSVNLEAREPLVDKDGQPLLRWKRDANKNKIGDKPEAVVPERCLAVGQDNHLEIRSLAIAQ
jgi:hypothetical protein